MPRSRSAFPPLRSLLAGLAWLGVLFAIDAADSYVLLERSTRRIRTDAATMAFLRDGVLAYVARVAVAYVLLGLAAGVALHLAMRALHPEPPRRRRWWGEAAALAAAVTLVGYAHLAVLLPGMFSSVPGIRWWADHAEPGLLVAAEAALALGLVALALRRHRRRPLGAVRPLGGLALWLAFVALALRSPPPEEPAANEGLNVLVLGVDALRPDHLGAFGYGRPTSPNMDALLADSAVFASTWTPLPRTYPAWVSLLTGALPITHGIRDNLPEPAELVPDLPLLPALARDAGWATGFATDDSRFSYMVPEMGWQRIVQPVVGPTNFAVSVNEPRFRAFHGLMHGPLGFSLVPVVRHNQAFGKSYRPWLFADRVQDLLAELSRSPRFFMAVHSCVLHAPGDRPYPYDRMFGQRGYRGPNRFHYSRSGTMLLAEKGDGGLSPEEIAAQDVRIYDSGVRMADDLVGQLLGALERSGLLDRTLVVLMSDHGEELWAPDLPYRYAGPNHGFHPYGVGQLRVVLGLRFPDGRGAGRRVEQPVRLVDLAPTLAEWLGLDGLAAPDGRSLLPLVDGAREEAPRPVYAETGLSEPRYWPKGHLRYTFRSVSERYRVDPATRRVYVRPEFRPQLVAAKDRIYQVGRWRLVWRPRNVGASVELYDIEADPYCREDRAAERPELVARLGLGLAPFLRRDGVDSPLFTLWEQRAAAAAGDPPPGD